MSFYTKTKNFQGEQNISESEPNNQVTLITKWLIILIIVSLTVGTASAFFLQSLDWVTQIREQHIWLIALLPLAGLMVGLLYHYYGKEVAAGNQILIDTIQEPARKIPFKMAPFIYLGTIITHLFGGSAGREGTALQMAAGIAAQLSNPFKLTESDRRILIIAAIAAGFGSVFGTPLAGAVFGVEFIFVKRIRYNAILPALIASYGADFVTKLWNTPHTTYVIDFVPTISFLNIFYTIIAGCLFGLSAVLFIQLLKYCKSFFNTFISYPPFRPLVAGVVITVAVFSLNTTQYIGLGIPIIVASFQTPFVWYFFIIKMLFTAVTLGSGFKGGEVTPLFFIGATLGSALSAFIPLPTPLLAGMGFVAVFAAASKTPIASSLIAVELFGIEPALLIALGCSIAHIVSGKNSIYNLPNTSIIAIQKNR